MTVEQRNVGIDPEPNIEANLVGVEVKDNFQPNPRNYEVGKAREVVYQRTLIFFDPPPVPKNVDGVPVARTNSIPSAT